MAFIRDPSYSLGSVPTRVVDADARDGKCTGVEAQRSGGGLADVDPELGPSTGDEV